MLNRKYMNKTRRKVRFYEGDGTPFRSVKPDRNAPCKCGSQKKQKACCGVESKYFHSKPPPKSNFEETIEQNQTD